MPLRLAFKSLTCINRGNHIKITFLVHLSINFNKRVINFKIMLKLCDSSTHTKHQYAQSSKAFFLLHFLKLYRRYNIGNGSIEGSLLPFSDQMMRFQEQLFPHTNGYGLIKNELRKELQRLADKVGSLTINYLYRL